MLSFKEMDDNLAVSHLDGTEIKRICSDGVYSFTYVGRAAALAVRDYATREEIPLVFTDVEKEELGGLVSLFRHTRIDALDPAASLYRVSVDSEGALFGEIEEIFSQDLTLSEILDSDIEEYARLSRDPEGLKYWGYDYREDNADADDAYFLSEMRRAREIGTAVSSALRLEDKFIGEAMLYAFDCQGGAEVGIRLLPEYRGMGLGGYALELLFELAEMMGVITLYATVFIENEPSVRLFSAYMDEVSRTENTVRFRLTAEEDE